MYIEVAAHMGNIAECPENTMPAFMMAELERAGLRVKETNK